MSGRVELFDVKSGKRLSEVSGDVESGTPPPDTPQSAMDFEADKNTGTGSKEPPPR